MYVCICKAVTDRDLDALVEAVGPSLECVQRACGAGTDCGACLFKVEKALRAHARASDEEQVPALSAG